MTGMKSKAQTTRHPAMNSTYTVNNVEVVLEGIDALPEGWLIEWEVSPFYHEDNHCTQWQDSLHLVKDKMSPDFDPTASFQSDSWTNERARFVADGRALYSDDVYMTKRHMLDTIKHCKVLVTYHAKLDAWDLELVCAPNRSN